MTPLAQRIVNADLEARKTGRQAFPELQTSNCHCFDVSRVTDVIKSLKSNHKWQVNDSHFFLPSPLTWIECRTDSGRAGALLCNSSTIEAGGKVINNPISLRLARLDNGELMASPDDNIFIGLANDGVRTIAAASNIYLSNDELAEVGLTYAATLSIINTPRIIGRHDHTPHVGMQKKIAAARGMIGRFKLREWTDIILEVTPPRIDLADHGTRLTGGKALHFCRSHLRIRFGKLELVSSHWRGDSSLGIKQSRYVVVP